MTHVLGIEPGAAGERLPHPGLDDLIATRERALEIQRRLAAEGAELVALDYSDPSGISRVKLVPIEGYAAAVTGGIGLSTVFSLILSNDGFAEAPQHIVGRSGDLRLHPDPDRTVRLAALDGWAVAPVDQYTQEGVPWIACPRDFLKRMTARLADVGLSVRMAFEFEFAIGRERPDGELQAAHFGPGYGAAVVGEHAAFLRDLLSTARAQGLGLEQLHPEYADGQFELTIAPRDPLDTADTSLVVRETIRAVALRHGWRASFGPLSFETVGNGRHLHLSLWRDDRNLMGGGPGPEGLELEGEAFLAGILTEMPALVAVTCPSPASYARLLPGAWSGGSVCWGVENREAAIRFVRGQPATSHRGANAEIKAIDGSSNPYLAIGAILAAGLYGMASGRRLPPPVTADPSAMTATDREALGIGAMPVDLTAAAANLAASTVLRDAMGDGLFEIFLATRREDARASVGVERDVLVRDAVWRY